MDVSVGSIVTMSIIGIIVLFFGILLFKILSWRRIVPTNVVHIVQQGKSTISYGVGKEGGNVYYEWPSWLPKLGVEVRELPVSNFDVDLKDYNAYDKDRLPFLVDVKAFFRIDNTNRAAEKVASFTELREQLTNVVKGAVRSILAKESLEHIMEERSIFGDKFTLSVNKDLENWGVVAIKSIELMDIRDTKDSHVIDQIMAKKMSAISSESRIEVAINNKKATEAELETAKEVDLKKALTEQISGEAFAKSKLLVGVANAETIKKTGIAEQQSLADIAQATQKTAEQEMEVIKTRQVKQAEINRESANIQAEQDKSVKIINSDAERQALEVIAQGKLEAAKKEAEGSRTKGLAEADIIQAKGTSDAEAKKAMEMASVVAQTTLAKEIGENKPYQEYLVKLREIEVSQVIGVKQAESLAIALSKADLKLLVNSGDVHSGLNKFSDLFSTKGAFQVNSILETLKQTEQGKQLAETLQNFIGNTGEAKK